MKIKNALYGVISVLMVAGLLLGLALSVNGRSDIDERATEEMYKTRVEEFRSSLKEYLNEEDFINCGIMITYSTDREHNERTYYVSLHHKRFDKLSGGERQLLISNIEDMSFADENLLFEVTIE